MQYLKSFLKTINLKYLGGDHNTIVVRDGMVVTRVLIRDDGTIITNGLSHNKKKLLSTYVKLTNISVEVRDLWVASLKI